MKKSFFIVGLLCFLMLFSCQDEEGVYYSCDKKEDAWVKENLSSIRKMEASEWFSVSENLKRPVYRALSLKQRQMVWAQKLENLMKNNEWKLDELEHLQKCYDVVVAHPEWLLPNSEKEEKDFDDLKIFAYKWISFAQKELGWSIDLVSAIVGTANGIRVVNGAAMIETGSSASRVKSSFECNCNSSNTVWTTCSLINCITNSCSKINAGCGFLWSDECDGLCIN